MTGKTPRCLCKNKIAFCVCVFAFAFLRLRFAFLRFWLIFLYNCTSKVMVIFPRYLYLIFILFYYVFG